MKRLVYIITAMIVLSSFGCSTGHYVSAQPETVVVTRPISPGAGYTWIDGDYYWHGGRYVYRNGYWARPRVGHTWNRGSWSRGSRGYYWRRGDWR